ncbi:transcription elongation factor TFIIS [Naganishia albida]|nr:transcription elongation factor TFIIS [Naganishia albida]
MTPQELKKLCDDCASAAASNKEDEALELLNKLEQLEPPSESDLRTSKAGATINKLQKNSSGPIAAIAKQIVTKWKHAVDAQKKRKREENGDARGEGNAEKKVKGEPGARIKAENVSSAVSSAKGSPAPSVKSESSRPIHKERKLSTITTEKRPERSSKSDNPPGLEPAYRSGSSEKDDTVRLKGATMSYDALAFDSIAEKAILVERALALEQAVYDKMEQHVNDEYRSRIRELFLNLREPTNAALRDSIVTGAISCKDVVNFTQEELASEAIKAEQAAIDKQNLFAAQGAGATEAETDAFKCGKCGQNKTRYYQMQTRSADEPMTNCNNRWKFS